MLKYRLQNSDSTAPLPMTGRNSETEILKLKW